MCVRVRIPLRVSRLSSLQLSLSYNGEQNKCEEKDGLAAFDHEFFFAIFCLGFPTLIMPLKKGHLSLSMCPIILSRFSALSVRSLVEIERAWYIYYARECVCVFSAFFSAYSKERAYNRARCDCISLLLSNGKNVS